MLENLKFDTTRCGNALRFNKNVSVYLDSLRYEIDKAANGHINANKLYYFNIKTEEFSYVLFKQAAIIQLKNSGNLRLIENKALANQILEYYDRWVFGTMSQFVETNDLRKTLQIDNTGIFYWQSFEKLNKRDTIFSYAADTAITRYIDSIPVRNPPLTLLDTNPADLRKMNNRVTEVERSLHLYNSFMKVAENLADTLIVQLEKEYDLKK
jgi:hypothetical protein